MCFWVKGRNHEGGWKHVRRNRMGPVCFQLKSFRGSRFLSCNRLLCDLINYKMNCSISRLNVIDYKYIVIDYSCNFF